MSTTPLGFHRGRHLDTKVPLCFTLGYLRHHPLRGFEIWGSLLQPAPFQGLVLTEASY